MRFFSLLFATALLLAPQFAQACACGCHTFDVSTSALLPNNKGSTAYVQYDYINQNRNFSGASRAPSDDNENKRIRTSFVTAGTRVMFNRAWGVDVKVPYLHRNVKSEDGSFRQNGIGDVRMTGIYSGFSDDMSTGLMFGVKLPTGDFRENGFERDTAIGTGSTDLTLGLYHQDYFAAQNRVGWFGYGTYQYAVATQDHYRPGDEANAAVGLTYDAGTFSEVKITPILQTVASFRAHDRGLNAEEDSTGYQRVSLSPGVEFNYQGTKLYTDVALPVYQHVEGNQLVPGAMFKVILSRNF